MDPFIQNQDALDKFLAVVGENEMIAIDTEFQRIRSYYPKLCLMQIATKNAAVCIDALAFDDLSAVFEMIYAPGRIWILHSARQDLEALYHLSGKLPERIFDTQIAATLLKFDRQISYQALVEYLLEVRLGKMFTRTDWTKRPLPDGALAYALDDVFYLGALQQELEARLDAENKLGWLVEETSTLLDFRLYRASLDDAWKRVRHIHKLKNEHQIRAIQLAAWREKTAMERDKPRRWVMPDQNLLDYAAGRKQLSSKSAAVFADFVTGHPNLQSISLRREKTLALTTAEKAQQEALQKLIEEKSKQYNIYESTIATRKSISDYVRRGKSPFLAGWRFEILKEGLAGAK